MHAVGHNRPVQYLQVRERHLGEAGIKAPAPNSTLSAKGGDWPFFDPTGERLYWVNEASGTPALWSYDLATKEQSHVMTFAAGLSGLVPLAWVSNSLVPLIARRDVRVRVTGSGMSELIVVDVDSGQYATLGEPLPPFTKVLSVNMGNANPGK